MLMTIEIKPFNIKITPALKEYVNKKFFPLGRYLKKFESKGDRPLILEIKRSTFHHRKGDVYEIKSTLRLKSKRSLTATTYGSNVRRALDENKKGLKLSLLEYKDKLQSRFRV